MGLRQFTRQAYVKHAKHYCEEDMLADMSGITCMVTGANSGLGYGIAEALAKRKATVYCVCRSEDKGLKAVEAIKESTKNEKVHLLKADLSSIENVRQVCTEYRESGKPLHVLVNNAGGMFHKHMAKESNVDAKESESKGTDSGKAMRARTPEGHELNFATNTLGTYHLTQQLLIPLKKSSSDTFKSRVITVSSGGMLAEKLEIEDLYSENKKGGDALFVYAAQKRHQVALTEYWAEKHNDKVTFVSMHPGWVGTPGVEKSLPYLYYNHPDLLRTVEQGADTAIWLSCLTDGKMKSITPGAFYHDRRVSDKHLCFRDTRYKPEQVAKLAAKLDSMLGQIETEIGSNAL